MNDGNTLGYGALAGFAGIWVYVTFQHGGVDREDRYWFVGAVALLSLAVWLLPRYSIDRFAGKSSLERWILLLPALPLAQLAPLPLAVVRVISPMRAEMAEAVRQVTGVAGGTALSVYPAGTVTEFLLFSTYILLFLNLRRLGEQFSEKLWRLAVPVLAVAGLEGLLGLLQAGLAGGVVDAHGTLENRDHYAAFLAMALPFAIVYPFVIFRRESGAGVRAGLKATGCAALGVLILAAILQSHSRMGFTAALFSLGVMGLLEFCGRARAKRLVWAAPACVLAVFILFLYLPSNHLIGRFAQLSYTEEASSGRIQLWRETLRLARDYPVLGCGLGAYEPAFVRYKEAQPSVFTDDYAHNDYVQLAAEGGIVGAALVLLIAGRILRRAARAFGMAGRVEDRYLALACIGSFSAILLHSVVDFNLHTPADAMMLAWICGISCSICVTGVQHWREIGMPVVLKAR